MDRPLIMPMDDKYQSYLTDESRLTGSAESISFPRTEDEIRTIITAVRALGLSITVQGGKTGIAGGAVPGGGHILNLSYMNRIKSFEARDGLYLLTVEPGVTLMDLTREIRKLNAGEDLFWPPDPTESTATVGGAASCNARGLCASLYGDTRKYIHAIRVMDAQGSTKDIVRGSTAAPSDQCAPSDPIDVYLGGEGMYGVITELTLRLIPRPKELWGICFFFTAGKDAFSFADRLTQYVREAQDGGDAEAVSTASGTLTSAGTAASGTVSVKQGAAIAAAEYLDRMTIDMIEERKPNISKIRELPAVPSDAAAMIYIEIHGADESSVESCAEALLELADECGVDSDAAWAVSGESETDKLRVFRHAAAETANLYIEKVGHEYPGITKLGMDMGYNGERLETVVLSLKDGLKRYGLRGCIFGHIFGNHLHMNILPNDFNQFEKGRTLMEELAGRAAADAGRQIREHGVGKLKKKIFLITTSDECLAYYKDLKRTIDPAGFWNPSNMLDNF